MPSRGPLAKNYPAAVALVVLCLVPFLMVSAAVVPLAHDISRQLGLSSAGFDIISSLAYGAYAFGTVMAVQLAVHLPQRRLLLCYVSLFVAATVLSASTSSAAVFSAAFIIEGLCTSLMLIAAVPPLVTGWPPPKMPWTGAVMNLCVFGAVAVGPSAGSFQLSAGEWRPLFWVVAGIGGLAWLFALLTYEDQPAQDKSAPRDLGAVALAGGGCGAAFFGAGELQAGKAVAPVAIVPLAVGFVMLVALVVHQYRARRPLMPVKQVATTLPVTGIVLAMSASAAAFGLMELVLYVLRSSGPLRTAWLFLPEFGAAVMMAALFGRLFRTRFTPVLALGGMVPVAAAAALVTAIASDRGALIALTAGLIGLGVGASVSPALFIAGFSLRSSQIQRVFALIELLRGVTAFLVAPVLMFVASAISPRPAAGARGAAIICLCIAAVGGLAALALFISGNGPRLQVPDLETWQHGEPAWESPPLLARLRRSGRHFSASAPAPAPPPAPLDARFSGPRRQGRHLYRRSRAPTTSHSR